MPVTSISYSPVERQLRFHCVRKVPKKVSLSIKPKLSEYHSNRPCVSSCSSTGCQLPLVGSPWSWSARKFGLACGFTCKSKGDTIISCFRQLCMTMAPFRHTADNISSWFVDSQHTTWNPMHAMKRDQMIGSASPGSLVETVGSSRRDVGYHVPPLSVSSNAFISRYPILHDLTIPKMYWSPGVGQGKCLPHKVSQDIKHKLGQSSMMIPSYSFDTASVLASTPFSSTVPGSEIKSKRAARKCKVEHCSNSVVQGGLCISHGAKRKQCSHPGCSKNVKKAGMCSAHGPARKKCEYRDCCNIAVQGGLCISHGAKKRLCCHVGCTKKARSTWNQMCKRHYDESLPDPSSRLSVTSATSIRGCESSSVFAKAQCYPVAASTVEA